MKAIPRLLLTALLIPCSQAEAEPLPTGKVYTYKEVEGVKREVEIYFPKDHDPSKKAVPGILFFHGGAWFGGKRSQFAHQCQYFADRGLVAGTVTYHLTTEEEREIAKVEGLSFKRYCIPDVKSAIRWFKQHADELGVDPQRIIVGGGSAGGHVCLLGTTTPGLNDPADPEGYDTSVAAYLLFNPAFAFAGRIAGDGQDPDVDLRKHLTSDFPPAIAFFGAKDNWKKGWDQCLERMRELEITTTETFIAEEQIHGFYNSQPWRDVTLIEADKFLKKLGLIEGEPTLAMPETGEKLVKQPASTRE